MSEWFYQSKKNEPVGPLTSKELLDKVRNGEISSITLVRKDDSQWVAADEVGELFSKAFDALKEHHCPFCGKICMLPPTTCTHCHRQVPISDEQRADRQEREKKELVADRRAKQKKKDELSFEEPEPTPEPRPLPKSAIGRVWRRFTDFLAVAFEREKE